MLRAVMDTNVLYSAFRSRLGASFAVFVALRHDRWRAVLSNHLLHEYEDLLKARASELNLSVADIDTLLAAICAPVFGSAVERAIETPPDSMARMAHAVCRRAVSGAFDKPSAIASTTLSNSAS